ncbi:MAG: hypothetical protein IKI72_07975 [Bacteroidales bacterium]|nr:hypothetical protein [Bacteroidales bacterium]
MNLLQHTFDNYVPFRCFRPVSVDSGGQRRTVGCYHCPACQSSRMQEYQRMIEIEASQSRYQYFITLTYDQDHLPTAYIADDSLVSSFDDGEILYPNRFDLKRFSVSDVLSSAKQVARYSMLPHGSDHVAVFNKRDIQLFLKRLRKYVSTRFSSSACRFFAIGEYGPRSLRPHYHIILFTDSEDLHSSGDLVYDPERPGASPLPSLWPLGRCSSELSKGQCAQYLSSYVVSTVDLPTVLQTRRFRPFVVHSQGFGFPKTYDLRDILSDPVIFDKQSRSQASENVGISISGIGKDGTSVFFRYPDAFFRHLFPKLPYSWCLERPQIYWLYGLYDSARSLGLSDFLTALAYDLTDIYLCLHDEFSIKQLYGRFCHDHNGSFGSYVEFVHFLCTLQSYKMVFPSDWDSRESCKDFFLRLLLVSRHLSSVCSDLNVSRWWFVDKILQFYDVNDYVKLRNFYAAQEFYFDSHPISHLKYFYDLEFSSTEYTSGLIFNPAKVNFLRQLSIGVYDSQLNFLKLSTTEHNSKLYNKRISKKAHGI